MPRPKPASPQPRHPVAVTTATPLVPLGFLVFTVLCTGSGIIMLEVLGARMAGPIFGVSLYIWTALITVTLAALSLGYWLGGMIADRRPEPNLMYLIILAAGIWIAFLPLIDAQVLVASYKLYEGSWAIRLGVLTGSLILFGPPLTLLGMVSPFAIKLALADLKRAGQTAGMLYAISTVGSVAGTIIAGYLLIPGIGVSNTLLVITALIVAPPLVWFVLRRRWESVVGAMLVVAIGASTAWSNVGQPRLPEGVEIIAKVDSHYGQLKVMDAEHGPRGDSPVRWLLLEGTAQTGVYKDSNELVSGYVELMARFLKLHLPEKVRAELPQKRQALLVGLGGGSLVRPLVKLGYEVDVVEIDPEVAELAAEYFGADPNSYQLITEDGRSYIRRSEKQYDAILLDVFSGGGQPFHLFSKESFEDIKRILKPDGVVGLNSIAFPEGDDAMLARSLVRTATSVLPHALTYISDPQDRLDDIQNCLMFFSQKPFPTYAATDLTEEEQREQKDLDSHRYTIDAKKGIVVNDDYNPVDRWTARVNEVWRERLFEQMGPEILAY